MDLFAFIFHPLRLLKFFLFLFTLNLEAGTLNIATYNIWNPTFEEKYSGINSWDQRLQFIINTIIESQSDVLCIQEASQKCFKEISEDDLIRSTYQSYYFPHYPSQFGQEEGRDGLAFFYRFDRIDILNISVSQAYDRPAHRRDFYVDCVIKQPTERLNFRIACTHLDSGRDLEIGNQQLQRLLDDISKTGHKKIELLILCGDFNEGEKELERPRFDIMQKAGFCTDGSTVSTRPESLNLRHSGHVDWIYFKALSDLEFELVQLDPIGNERASDHKLTTTQLNF